MLEAPSDVQTLATTEERPAFGPNQVTSPDQLKRGRSYRLHYDPPIYDCTIKVIEDPEGRWIVVELNGSNQKKSLADMGIIQYLEGQWHPNNWTEKIPDPEK